MGQPSASIESSLGGQHESIGSLKNINSAEHRLRTIEMISKFREDKIRKEFFKLECDLKAQEEQERIERQKQAIKRQYLKKQRVKIEEYNRKK